MSEPAGAFALNTAVSLARDYAKQAEAYRSEDIYYCLNYLQAARAAVQGLETEYDQILVQAASCSLADETAVEALQQRIDTYLHVDQLRPELQRAITGLRATYDAMQRHAAQFLQWPWVKENRQAAVFNFASLLGDLETYLAELDSQGLEHRSSGTGVGTRWLHELRQILGARHLVRNPEAVWARILEDSQADRTKDNLLLYTSRIEATIQQLLRAFR